MNNTLRLIFDEDTESHELYFDVSSDNIYTNEVDSIIKQQINQNPRFVLIDSWIIKKENDLV